MRALLSLLILLPIATIGCAEAPDPADSPAEPSFGLPGKADEGGCDSTSPLCWTSDDARALRVLQEREDAVLLGLDDATDDALALVSAIDALAHKLPPVSAEMVEALRSQAAAMPAEAPTEDRAIFVGLAREVGTAHLIGGFFAAHSVDLAQRAEAGDKRDDAAADPTEDDGLTPDMRDSLRLLTDSGIFGRIYATLLRHSGVLERQYSPWDEAFPFSEPREGRARRIVDRFQRASIAAAIIGNLEALIPYAGIAISVPHEALMLFRYRARMVFELAAVYGLDVREGHNLLLAMGAYTGATELADARVLTAATMAIPLLAQAAARAGRVVWPPDRLAAAILHAMSGMLQRFSARGAEILARLGQRAALRGAGRQILGYATFGLALIGEVAATAATTGRIGRHAAAMMRPWGGGMFTVGAEWLDNPTVRECAMALLGSAALADGTRHPDELALIAAHIDRHIFVVGEWRPMMRDDWAYGRALAALSTDPATCFEHAFVGRPTDERLTVLSWALVTMAIDGRLDEVELTRYAEWTHALRGDGYWFDGAELEDEELEAVRTRIETTFVALPAFIDVVAAQALADLPAEARFEIAPVPDPAVVIDVARALRLD